jgi:hypothetical protein
MAQATSPPVTLEYRLAREDLVPDAELLGTTLVTTCTRAPTVKGSHLTLARTEERTPTTLVRCGH